MPRAIAMSLRSVTALLGVALLACAPLGERAVDVDFLWVRTQAGQPTPEGGVTRTRITLAPNPGGEVRVGVYEESPGSIGESWRASVWMSAVMSALATGQPLDARKLMVEASGFIDGPSAGSLMTAAMMAARLGVAVRDDVTMTGTVNPDGSIGPVAGLPIKLRAALRGGKKLVGYPTGQGRALDPTTGRSVDLVALARESGAQAVEIDDIDAAYALLTGRTIARPRPLSAAEMRLPPELDRALRGPTEASLRRAQAAYRQALAGGVSDPALVALWQRAYTHFEETRRYLARGQTAVAWWHAALTAIESDVGAGLTRLTQAATSGDLPAALAELRQRLTNVDRHFTAASFTLRGADPRGIDATLTALDAFEGAVSSYRRIAQAQTSFAGAVESAGKALASSTPLTPERRAAVLAELERPLFALALADVNLQSVQDTLARIPSSRGRAPESSRRGELARLFTHAALANLHYFDALYVEPYAEAQHVSRDAAQIYFARSDEGYLAARAHLNLAQNGLGQMFRKGSPPDELARLSGALSSFFSSSSVIAQYDSLKVQRDPESGAARGIGRQRIFWRLLTLAERKAREHAALAREVTGSVPTPALLAYQIGLAYEERAGLDDRLQALEQFWRASMWSQLAVLLAR